MRSYSKMRILIFGGTGAMGEPLAKRLVELNNSVFVTSRKPHKDNKVQYFCGNAKDDSFLSNILQDEYDVIVDFMVYSTEEFKARINLLLNKTKQYIFISSARCYANSIKLITEDSARLVDVSGDNDYLSTDDYSLAKARQENVLYNSSKKNWTIVRPYITYNAQRLQLGCYEKDYWLYRVLHNKTIVLPEDIMNCTTSITFGEDVANCITKLIGNKEVLGECYTVATKECHTWKEILEMYSEIIWEKTGENIKIKFIPNSTDLYGVCDKYQIMYDRLYNRAFDSTKLEMAIGKFNFTSTMEGLNKCVNDFLESEYRWSNISSKYEAWSDRHSKEYSSLKEFVDLREKLRYIKWRFFKKP